MELTAFDFFAAVVASFVGGVLSTLLVLMYFAFVKPQTDIVVFKNPNSPAV